jgi:hypothetical protein
MKDNHGKRKAGFKVIDGMFKMSYKKPKPSTYNPEWNKKKPEGELVGAGEPRQKRKYTRRQPLPPVISSNGTLTIPCNLEIDFTVQIPRIVPESLEPQVIKVGGRKKK